MADLVVWLVVNKVLTVIQVALLLGVRSGIHSCCSWDLITLPGTRCEFEMPENDKLLSLCVCLHTK